MTFEDEETRTTYHGLPAQTQLEYCELEVSLARKGKRLHVLAVLPPKSEELQVVVRIDEKANFASSV